MKRKNIYLTAAFLIGCFVWLLSLPRTATSQQAWVRLDREGGGVFEDLQTLEVGDADVLWAASMGTGLFRNTYSNGSWNTNSFTEYLPGHSIFGVDAIAVTSGTTTEYVLVGTGKNGIYYQSATGGNFATNGWNRPTGFTNNWNLARVHDIAFYWPQTGNPSNMQTEYFAILHELEDEYGSYNSGLYRWKADESNFKRIDVGDPYPERKYSHFYRDIATKNVLYAIRGLGPNTPPDYYGGLVKISGTYASPTVADVTIVNNLQKVFGFSQWMDGSDVYSYVSVAYRDQSDIIHYAVYCDKNGSGYNAIWTDYTPGVEAVVIGKPYTSGVNTHHYLWMLDGGYGAWFHDTGTNTSVQINGSTNLNDDPDLKRWSRRAVIPDIQGHVNEAAGEKMRLIAGTHHGGIYYLTYTTSPTWTPVNNHVYAVEP